MSTAAVRIIAPSETAKQSKTLAAPKGVKAKANNYSAQVEAQRRKWGTETAAVSSVHARKF